MSAGAAGTLGICLALAAQGAAHRDGGPSSDRVRFIPTTSFTLAWTHSIEKTRWEEDYRVIDGSPPRLHIDAARIRGSGAGMEPPSGAVLQDGWYVYTPEHQPGSSLRLTRSRYTPDFEACSRGRCRPLSAWLPSDGGVTLLWACRRHGPARVVPTLPADVIQQI